MSDNFVEGFSTSLFYGLTLDHTSALLRLFRHVLPGRVSVGRLLSLLVEEHLFSFGQALADGVVNATVPVFYYTYLIALMRFLLGMQLRPLLGDWMRNVWRMRTSLAVLV